MRPRRATPGRTLIGLGGFGVSLAVAVGIFAADRAGLLDRDQASVALVVAGGLLLVGSCLVAWGWWRSRRTHQAERQPTQAITGEHIVGVVGDNNSVSVGSPPRRDMTLQRAAINDCIAVGLAIQTEVDRISPAELFRGYDKIYRPKVMAWHQSTAATVERDYSSVRGTYSGEAQLAETIASRLQVSFTRDTIRDIHAEVQLFLRGRISELRALLGWRED